MITNLNEYKCQKLNDAVRNITLSTKENGLVFAEACYSLAYKVREYESQLNANERNK